MLSRGMLHRHDKDYHCRCCFQRHQSEDALLVLIVDFSQHAVTQVDPAVAMFQDVLYCW
jgi:hypothetical protein